MAKPGTSFLVNFVMASALLYVFSAVLWPFTLALVLAILIIALSNRVVRLLPKARRWMVFTITAVILGGIIAASMAVVLEGAARIVVKMPDMLARINQLLALIHVPGGGVLSVEALAQKVELGPLADRLLGGIQNASAGLGLTLIFLFFLLVSRSMIEKRVQSIIASRGGHGLSTVLKHSFSGVESYMYVQSVTGLMIAIGSWAVMAAVGLDNALFWGLVIFLCAYLPVLGVLAGSIGPTLFALLQFPSLTPAIAVFVGIQLVSSFVGNFVLPKMQADSQNIDPAASLIAVGMWTVLWGVPGAFLAIPLTLALMYALAQYDELRWLAVLISHDGDPTPMEPAE